MSARAVHPRRRFLWRFATCVALAWVFASFVVWMLGRLDAPPWIVAIFTAPLWATLGAVYVEDHYRRRA